MKRIMFVCLGNVCRSPMAEMVFRDLVRKAGLEDDFVIASAATSNEELGNPPHRGTQAELRRHGISWGNKRAVRLKASDYRNYDLFLGMDRYNIRNMKALFGGDPENKVHLLKEWTDGSDVDDPWWTNDFETTYRDISAACSALLADLSKNIA